MCLQVPCTQYTCLYTSYVSGHSQLAAAPLRPVAAVALALSLAPRQTQTASEEVGVYREFSLTDIVTKCFSLHSVTIN